jgi:hypothetical protein
VNAALYLVAFATAALVGTHGLAYWDAADYTRLALEGGTSGLLLGRPLFLWISRVVVRIDPNHAEPLLRWFWTAVSATAAPLLCELALALNLGRRAAFVAGMCLALSPSFAHTSHQVLTDGPALAASIAAVMFAANGRALPAGILLAIAVATRESSIVSAVAIVLLLGRRSILALSVAALLTVAVVLVAHPPSLAHWGEAMGKSSQQHPLSARDVGISLGWVLAAGPVPVLVALRFMRPKIIWPYALATLLLVFYPDGSFSPRYVLATVPFLFLGAAQYLADRPRLCAIALTLPIALTKLATRRTDAIAERGAQAMKTFSSLAPNAIVVPGHYCAHVRLQHWQRKDIKFICPGWDWPDDLNHALAGERHVYIDLRNDAWVGAREYPNRDQLAKWVEANGSRPLLFVLTP